MNDEPVNAAARPAGIVRAGFTLVEMLVVLAIIAILVTIAIPVIVGNPEQRQLRTAADRYTADMRYARSQAERTSSKVYLVFNRSVDSTQVQRPWVDRDGDGSNDFAIDDPVVTSGDTVVPALNPGVGRTAQSYYIVQEQPRTFPGHQLLEEIDNRVLAIRQNASDADDAQQQIEDFLNTGYLEGNDPRIGWIGKLPAIAMRPDLTVGELRAWLTTKVGQDFTYLDLFNDRRLFENLDSSDQATVTQTREPQYPRKSPDVAPAGERVTLESAEGDGNRDTNLQSWPLIVTPTRLSGLSDPTGSVDLDFSYQERLCDDAVETPPFCELGENSAYEPAFFSAPINQYFKVFNENSFFSVGLMKRRDNGEALDDFTDNPNTDGSPNPAVVEFNPEVDNPELQQPVVDYNLLRERELGERVHFVNAFSNLFLTGYNGDLSNSQTWRLMNPQFLQYGFVWNPDGTMSVEAWTWSPSRFPASNENVNAFEGQVHGDWVEVSSKLDLQPRVFFITTDEALAFENTDAFGNTPSTGLATRIDTQAEASQKDANAVRITFWPTNGQERVDAYTPNDANNRIFNMPAPSANQVATDVEDNLRATNLNLGEQNINVVRSEGFNQNYLVP